MFSLHYGVAKVQVFGGQQLAMRVWLDTDKLAGRNLTASDVADAIRRNNYHCSSGKVEGEFVIANVYVNTDLTNVEEFKDMGDPQ